MTRHLVGLLPHPHPIRAFCCPTFPGASLLPLFLAAAPLAFAQTVVWDGGGANNNWSTAANWTTDVAPANNGTATVQFAGNTRLSPHAEAAWNLAGLGFASGADAFTLGGQTLTLGAGGIVSNAGTTQTIGNALMLGAAQTWTNAGDLAATGVVSGAGRLTKDGGGTLTLSASNTYTGGTTINGGRISIDSGTGLGAAPGTATPGYLTFNGGTLETTTTFALSSNRGIALEGDGALSIASGTTLTYGGIIAGAGRLTKYGTGTLLLSGSNTYTGGTTLSTGTVSIASGTALGAAPATVTADYLTFSGGTVNTTGTFTLNANRGITLQSSGGTLDTASGTTLTFGGIIAGAGGLTKAGSGTLGLSGANTYSGDTAVAAGTLRLDAANVLPDTTAVSIASGATLNLAGYSDTVSAFSGAGSLALGAGTLTVDNTASTTFSGAISGTGGLVKAGSGTLTLSGSSTYTGGTTIQAGTLAVDSGTALGAAPGSPTPGYLTFQGGTLQTTASFELNGNRGIALDGNGGIAVSPATTLTYGGIIAGSSRFTKSGAGTLVLSGANTYSGGTTVSGGTLSVGSGGALGAVPDSPVSNYLILTGGTLQTTNSFTLHPSRGINIYYAGGTFDTASGTTLTYGGIITGLGGLTKEGSGTFVLSGANAYSRDTNVNAGTLQLGASHTLPEATAVTIATAATLDLNSKSNTISALAGSGYVDLGSGTLTLNVTGLPQFSGEIYGSGRLIKTGTGTQAMFGSSTYSGTTTVTGGALAVIADAGLGVAPVSVTPGSLTLDGGALTAYSSFILDASRGLALGAGGGTFNTVASDVSYDGIIAGTGRLTKEGEGKLLLRGNSTYTGGTTLNGGTVIITRGTALGAAPDTPTPGYLTFDGGTLMASESFSLNANRGIQLNPGGGTIEVKDDITFSYGGIIAGSGRLSKDGNGILLVSGASTYTGGTRISDGKLKLAYLGSNLLPGTTAVTVSSGASLDLGWNNNLTIGSLAGAGEVFLGQGMLTVGTNNTDTAFSGVIGEFDPDEIERPENNTHYDQLKKVGTGTLTLTGQNTYDGGTFLEGGTLSISQGANLGAIAGPGVNNITFDGGTLRTTETFELSWLREMKVASVGTLEVDSGTTLTYRGSIRGSRFVYYDGEWHEADSTFTKAGGGTLLLGTNSGDPFTQGRINVADGTLRLAAANFLDDNIALTVAAGARFDLNDYNTTLGSLAGAGSVTLGSGDLTLHGSTWGDSTQFSGVISGSGRLSVAHDDLVLSGANTYSGGTRITDSATVEFSTLGNFGTGDITLDGGRLRWATGSTVDVSSRLNPLAASGGTIDTNGNDVTLASVISGPGRLGRSGDGTLYLTATNTHTGGTLISSGTLSIFKGTNLGPDPDSVVADYLVLTVGTLQTTATFALNANRGIDSSSGTLETVAGTTLAYGGVISGASIAKAGAGTLVLSGANAYTGATNVNTGTLQLGAGDVLPDTSAVTVAAGATLDFGAYSDTIKSLEGAGSVTFDGGTLTVAPATTTSFAGVIAGTGGFTKAGAGVFTLAGSNTYLGATTLTAGTLAIAADDALGTASGGSLVFHGGTLRATTSLALDSARSLSIDTTGGLEVGSGTTLTFVGTLAGTGTLTKSGAGSLVLSGSNTYAGATTVSGGTLIIGADAGLGAAPASTTPGHLTLTNSTLQSTASFTLAANRGVMLSGSSPTFETDADTTLTYHGVLASSGSGYLNKTGAGTLVLGGSNTYSGVTTINSGTLRLAANNAMPNTGRFVIAANGTFDLHGFTDTIPTLEGSGRITLGGGMLSVGSASGSTVFGGIVSGSGGLTVVGGTLTLTEANTFDGPITVNGGTLKFGAADALPALAPVVTASGGSLLLNGYSFRTSSLTGGGGSVNLGTGTLTVANDSAITYSGSVIGNGGLTKDGSAMLTLSGSNTYSGPTTVSAGTLRLGAGNRFSDYSDFTVVAGATLDLAGYSDTVGSLAGSGSVTLGGGSLTAGYSGASTIFDGVVSGGGGFTKVGSGTLNLSGANTYTGTTTISAGTLAVTNNNALGTTGTGTTIANGAALALSGGVSTAEPVNARGTGVGSSGAIRSTAGANALTGNTILSAATSVGADSGSTLFLAGTISGPYALTKVGTGTLELSGANTYSGGTTVSTGTLRLANSSGSALGTGNLTVASGAMFTGAGSFTGALQLNGRVAPGHSPGILATGSETWNSGGSYLWEINHATGTAGTNWDLLSISGALTIAATSGSSFTISLFSLLPDNSAGPVDNFNAAANYSYVIASTSGGIIGFDATKFTLDLSDFQHDLAGGTWSLGVSGHDLNLNFTTVPEPSAYAAILGIAALLLTLGRRRKQPLLARPGGRDPTDRTQRQ